jgi:F420-non-reducing hydrogenase large subunit
MELHSIGRKMTSLIGGRNVHPVNVRIGGMANNPLTNTDFDFHTAAGNAQEIGIEFLSTLKSIFDAETELVESLGVIPTNYMALSNADKVSFVEGQVRCVGKDGSEISSFDSNSYFDHIAESIASHTYMKLPYIKKLGETEGLLRVNCLARVNVNNGYGTSLADKELQELRDKWGNPLEHSLLSHWARLIELLYATERIQDLLDSPSLNSDLTAVDLKMSEGEAVGCLEAPRGTLFHHYSIKNKQILKANLVVATQHNAHAVNHALTQTVSKAQELGLDQDKIIHHCEMVVRAYDPCISCSTHIVELKEER